MPKFSRRGNAYLRSWLYLAALNAVRKPGPFRELYERRQAASPGRGAKKRALVAVADKLVRVLFAMTKHTGHCPQSLPEGGFAMLLGTVPIWAKLFFGVASVRIFYLTASKRHASLLAV